LKFTQKVLVKTKPFNRQTVISINQLFKVLSTRLPDYQSPIQDVDDLKQQNVLAYITGRLIFSQAYSFENSRIKYLTTTERGKVDSETVYRPTQPVPAELSSKLGGHRQTYPPGVLMHVP